MKTARLSRAAFAAGGFAVVFALAPAVFAEDGMPAPAPGAPPAAPAPVPEKGRFFDQFDANQDGKVTKEEFVAMKGDESTFDVIDMDKDGLVTLAELGLPADFKPDPSRARKEEPMGGKFDRQGGGELRKRLQEIMAMDKNGDGKVAKDEYTSPKPAFEILDRNKDGFLSGEDFRGMKPGQGGPGSPEEALQRFKEQDKNGDGKVAKDEFMGPPERFDVLDANKDGAITLEEIQAAFKAMPPAGGDGKLSKRYDKNGDGKITREEFPGTDETFKAMDKNADGSISGDELEGLKLGKLFGKKGEGKPGDPAKTPEGGEMPPPPGEMPGPGAGSGGLPPLFAVLDKNRDGKITRDEFPGNDDEWRKMDRDSNGWITPDETK